MRAIAAFVAASVTVMLSLQAVAQEAAGRPAAGTSIRWVDTNTFTDWGGHDHASTSGEIPDYSVRGFKLCDAGHIGFVATCWSNRPNGFPADVPTDISGSPAAWCTYKDGSVNVLTPKSGKAPLGRVYVCGRTIPR